jgi:hypothetical protein
LDLISFGMSATALVPPVFGGIDAIQKLLVTRDRIAKTFFSQGSSQTWGGLVASSFGGPLVVGLLTPQRNAMTLAAKDVTSSYIGLYKKVFQDGLLNSFRGGGKPTLSACPQFTAIGPVYLGVERYSQSALMGMVVASTFESLLTFSAQRTNAKIQFNAFRTSAQRLALDSGLTGPGFTCHVLRNLFAMGGIRLMSPYTHQFVQNMPGSSHLSSKSSLLLSDFISSTFAATLSMPFNHVFSWSSCTPELNAMSYTCRAKAQANFIITNYKEQGWRLLRRDLSIRISYTAVLFTLYRAIERHVVG